VKKRGRAKLTAEQADLIRAEYSQGGVTQRALAEKYQVSQMAIWQVLSNRTFRPTGVAA
jgi:transcriptional regulator with XRE-family HTH domain